MRGSAFFALTGAALGYLAYKAEYLELETSDALKIFILSPGAVLLILAVFVAFPDARRRLASTLLALGFIALIWLAREPPTGGGWTFYTPYSSFGERTLPRYFKGPSPLLAAVSTLLPLIGLALFRRRSIPGTFLLGVSLWCALCFAPSRWTAKTRRYYYYDGQGGSGLRPSEWDRSDAVLPILLGIAGAALLIRPQKEEGREESLRGPLD